MKNNNICTLTAFMLILLFLLSLVSCLSQDDRDKQEENEAIESAEKYANQKFYKALGVAAEKTSAEVIYSSDNYRLIVVKLYISGNSYTADGSVCVKTYYGTAVSSTDVRAPEYPFKQNLNEIKAYFGL